MSGKKDPGTELTKVQIARARLLPPKWRDIMLGVLDPAELDDEEIFSTRLRQSNGVLGPKPPLVPQQFIDEQNKRMLSWASQHVRDNLQAVLRTVTEIATDPNQAAADRLKAAFWIAERYLGKVPDKVMLTTEDPVEALFRNILNNPDGLAPHEPSAAERERAGSEG